MAISGFSIIFCFLLKDFYDFFDVMIMMIRSVTDGVRGLFFRVVFVLCEVCSDAGFKIDIGHLFRDCLTQKNCETVEGGVVG